MAGQDQQTRDRLSSYKKAHERKVALLSDAAKMDKYVSGISQQVSPTMKMAPKSKADLLTDRVDRSIGEGSPMKGFGPEFRSRFSSELARPENAGYSANKIATGITRHMLSEKGPTGKSRLERAYADYRVEASNRDYFFFASSKRKKFKAPTALPGMPTYEEWKAKTREQEDRTNELEGPSTALADLAVAGLTGASFGASLGLAGAPITFGTTSVAGAVLGGASAMAANIATYPIKHFLGKTEWYRSRAASDEWTDNLVAGVVKYGPEVLATLGVEKVVSKAILKSTRTLGVAQQAIIAKPTAARVSELKDAKDALKKDIKTAVIKEEKALARPTNMKKNDGVKIVDRLNKANDLGLSGKEVQSYGKKYGVLSKSGQVAAEAHPNGVAKGILVETEKEGAMATATGKVTADEVVKQRVKPPSVKQAKVGKKKETLKTGAVSQKAVNTVTEPKPEVVAFKPTYIEGDPVVNFVLHQQEQTLKKTKAGKETLELIGRNSQEEKIGLAVQRDIQETQLVVANIGADGKVYYGKPGELHYNLSERYGEQIRKTAGLEPGEATWKEVGFAGPDGKVLTREQALKKTTVKSSMGKELDAADLREQTIPAVDLVKGEKKVLEEAKVDLPTDISTTTKALSKQDDELVTYSNELLEKYYPNLDPKTNRPAMVRQVTEALEDLPTKLSKTEKAKFTTVQTKSDDLANTVVKLKEELSDISLDEMRTSMVSIIDDEKAGRAFTTATIKKVDDIMFRVEQSPTLLSADKQESIGMMSQYVARLRKQEGIIKFLTAFGVGGATLESLTADEAEAGIANVLGKISKEAIEKAVTSTITGLKKQRLSVGRVAADDVFHLPEKAFQTGLMETVNGGAKYFIKNLDKIYRQGSKRFAQGAMSPQSIFTEVLKATEGTLLNPAVFKATFFNAEAVNVKNGLRVMSNIFKEGDVVSSKTEISKMFEPLAKKAEKQYLYDYHIERAGEYKDKIGKLRKPDKETVNSLKHKMYEHKGMAKKLIPDVDDYHNAYQEVAEQAAIKHRSARVFFAADDSVKFKKYPFMKKIGLSEDEMLAVGRIKNQMTEYRVRLEKNQVKTLSGEYMHYSLHPDMKTSMLAELTGDSTATPYMKNFTRSANARPLMPDAVESMGRYIPDAERRIQTQAFWNSGWKDAMRASSKIEPLQTAFKALEDGTKPFENTWGNNLARWYTNVEVFKRLFMSPSAGLKHLVKLTGDMATLGVGETLQAMPGSVKTVSHRVIENTPFMKKIAGNLYNPSQYTKLKKQLLDSVAPAMDTRYRMMQMGYGNYDTYFSKLGVIADKVNHVGGMFINAAELIDRGTTMEAGLRIAAKKGMTPDQAIYGIYDTILKNNFLGREFTPRWMREPMVKAAFMFQTTPAKILGKKLVMAMRTKRAVKGLGKDIQRATKTPEGRQKLYADFINLKGAILKTDQEVKANLFIDALKTEQDFYGNMVVGQFAKDIMIMGAGTAVSGSVGLNLSHHFFHIPFLKNSEYTDTYGALSLSPVFNAVKDGSREYNKKIADDEDSIRVVEIAKKWMGKSGPFPDTLAKYNRISNDDIPDIYQGSPLQYLFAIPSKKEKD